MSELLKLRTPKSRKLVASVRAREDFSDPIAFKARDSDISDSGESCTKTRPSNPEGRVPGNPGVQGDPGLIPGRDSVLQGVQSSVESTIPRMIVFREIRVISFVLVCRVN